MLSKNSKVKNRYSKLPLFKKTTLYNNLQWHFLIPDAKETLEGYTRLKTVVSHWEEWELGRQGRRVQEGYFPAQNLLYFQVLSPVNTLLVFQNKMLNLHMTIINLSNIFQHFSVYQTLHSVLEMYNMKRSSPLF